MRHLFVGLALWVAIALQAVALASTPMCPVPGNGGCTGGPANLPSIQVAVLQTGNPVHLGDGNKYLREVDLSARPRLLGLELVRHYNSRTGYRGLFGVGWRMSYEAVATVDATGVQIVQADGRRIGFARNPLAPSSCLASSPADGRVDVMPDGTLVWQWPGGRRLEFAASGRLERIVADRAHVVSLSYDTRGHLVGVSDPAGDALQFDHEPAADSHRLRVSAVRAPLATWRYRYDRLDNLVEVVATIDGHREVTRYGYELHGGGGDPHNLTDLERTTDADPPQRAHYEYDALDRVVLTRNAALGVDLRIDYVDDRRVRVTDAAGASTSYELAVRAGRFVLEASSGEGCRGCPPARVRAVRGRQGIVDLRIGVRAWRFKRDAAHRLVEVSAVDIDGAHLQRLRFDYAGGAATPYRAVPADGLVAVRSVVPAIGWSMLELDAAARPLRLADPTGQRVELLRDRAGRIVERIDRDGSIRLRYDRAGRVVALTRAGRTTRVEWGRFGLPVRLSDSQGDERFDRDPQGRLMRSPATAPAAASSRLARVAWRTAAVDIDGWSYEQRLQRVLQQAAFDATGQLAETLRLLAQAPTLAAAGRAMRVWAAAGMTPDLWLGPALADAGHAALDEPRLGFIDMNRSTFDAVIAARCLSELDGTAMVLADLAEQAIAELGVGADARVPALFDAIYSMRPNRAWQQSPITRGRRIEQALGQNLPDTYPVIDSFDAATARGRAITSFDLDAASHADADQLLQDLVERIDLLARFDGVDWGGIDTRGRLAARTFSLVVNGPGSAAQRRSLQDAEAYAEAAGVDWQLIVMP